jgi:hypothetical protein
MATSKVTINLFKRITTSMLRSGSAVYTVPFDRAGIILNALTTNSTNSNRYITIGLLSGGQNNSILLNRFPLDNKEVINATPYKVILEEGDSFFVSADIEDITSFSDPETFWEFNLPISAITFDNFQIDFTTGTQVTADFGTGDISLSSETSLVPLTSFNPVSFTYDLTNETGTNVTLSILEAINTQ